MTLETLDTVNNVKRKLPVLVLGGGGREHAIVAACRRSPSCGDLYAMPGNPGIASLARCCKGNPSDAASVLELCRQIGAELVIVGPEAPLAAGVADALRQAGISVFGPGRYGAQLEASKAYAKDFMKRRGVPTADFRICSTLQEAWCALEEFQPPYIVKASGLAAGKGVFVEPCLDEAKSICRQLLEEKILGDAGSTLVIEEALTGRELSLMVITDGKDYRLLPTSQDHKRLLDGDRGPNTGGMGAYAPAPWVTEALMDRIKTQVVEPTLEGLRAEGLDYRGVLYLGLMIGPEGAPKVLEYNVRLGDPEAEVLLPLFEGDWVELCRCCADGQLASFPWKEAEKKAVCLVLASENYPTGQSQPQPIEGIDVAESLAWVSLFHAGTTLREGHLMATGGRVLCLTALGDDMASARDRAYQAVERISFRGMQYRRDIAHQAFEE